MFLAQEIYYTTTGTYRTRKSMYLVYGGDLSTGSIAHFFTRHELEKFERNNSVCFLPSLNVTPKQFKHFNDLSGKRF